MGSAGKSPLVSSQPSDSGLRVVLHPLVLLTISDYITRHTLRSQEGPIVGALLGQQNEQEITIQHAFECATVEQDGDVILHAHWFTQRLEQMKTIYKSPQLDLVGWYTVLPKSGPTPAVLPIHNWISSEHNESALLLAFHPEEAVQRSAGSKLPLTIYESSYEADEPPKTDQDDDKEMRDGEPPLPLRFRELPYSVETDRAEMISIEYVARGPGNATLVQPREQKKAAAKPVASVSASAADPKGKRPAEPEAREKGQEPDEHILSREEEETIAALTAKANAVRTLQSRVNLLTTYLERLPPSYLSPNSATDLAPAQQTTPSHAVLRAIRALVSRLPLLAPPDAAAYALEMLREANDVRLMELLDGVLQSVADARELGKKHLVVEASKAHNKKVIDGRPGNLGTFTFSSLSGPGDLAI
ncbi:hypothetical protein GGS23DRAFT_546103 [Durotheca rogersii]|uniref:uncharacterized protein n=1 Tax=Durotheca rogersii TaxID=419775 RepID=UPI00221F9397|nr:uncharacterized protein GGS23DRAFT_546103 [Durotheca rogersii]KAI5868539.1 hypothetical protein GGS23DRAFT_546103 [Durotheca rogersii]